MTNAEEILYRKFSLSIKDDDGNFTYMIPREEVLEAMKEIASDAFYAGYKAVFNSSSNDPEKLKQEYLRNTFKQ